MGNALEVINLNKRYNDFRLNSVSFALPEGKIMGFVGQNGAGKTTTIRCILNMAERSNGEIKIYGLDNIHDEMAVKQEIAAVFDDIFFVDTWRIRDIDKILKGFYDKWDSAKYAAYLKEFELSPEKRVRELSRGMKMKLMLAVAMSHGAKLLILDEPTSGLDPVARDELLDILSNYISDGEKSVFFSTHITSDLDRIADYVTLIDHGKIFYTGEKTNLLNHFRIISGSPADITTELKGKIIGLSYTSEGFNGMIESSDAANFPSTMATRAPVIDEILIHISKEGGQE